MSQNWNNWTVLKCVIDDDDDELASVTDGTEQPAPRFGLHQCVQVAEEHVQKYVNDYIVSLHYLQFPVVICYGPKKVPALDTRLVVLSTYIEPVKVVMKMLLTEDYEVVHGLDFIVKDVDCRRDILNSKDQYTFDQRASMSGLTTYEINGLRAIWTNRRCETLTRALPKTHQELNMPRWDHPLCQHFYEFLRQTYKRGIDRFKAFICIGSSYIGKSVFFTEFVIPKEYYVYHSNNLEYSKMQDQPHKVFRILDDIKWDDVKPTDLKALMNRNVSSVDVKYGYEYIFPLIPIIILNKEDFVIFRKTFTSIWEFIERNTYIYPPQRNAECEQETEPLFTRERCIGDHEYLFDRIFPTSRLHECTGNNLNAFIKQCLDDAEGYYYNNNRYLQLPMVSERSTIPNPEIEKNAVLSQYSDFLLKKKQIEMETFEKKPRESMAQQQERLSEYRRLSQPWSHRSRVDDSSQDDDDDSSVVDNNGINDLDAMDDDDDSKSWSNDDDIDDSDFGSSMSEEEKGSNGFIEL